MQLLFFVLVCLVCFTSNIHNTTWQNDDHDLRDSCFFHLSRDKTKLILLRFEWLTSSLTLIGFKVTKLYQIPRCQTSFERMISFSSTGFLPNRNYKNDMPVSRWLFIPFVSQVVMLIRERREVGVNYFSSFPKFILSDNAVLCVCEPLIIIHWRIFIIFMMMREGDNLYLLSYFSCIHHSSGMKAIYDPLGERETTARGSPFSPFLVLPVLSLFGETMLLTRVKKDTCVTESVSRLCALSPIVINILWNSSPKKGDMRFMSKRRHLERQRWQEKKNNQSLLFSQLVILSWHRNTMDRWPLDAKLPDWCIFSVAVVWMCFPLLNL